MTPKEWLDVAQKLGEVRDTLLSHRDTWNDEVISAGIYKMAMATNALVIDAFKKGMKAEDTNTLDKILNIVVSEVTPLSGGWNATV